MGYDFQSQLSTPSGKFVVSQNVSVANGDHIFGPLVLMVRKKTR
jgi:hypothetical protein